MIRCQIKDLSLISKSKESFKMTYSLFEKRMWIRIMVGCQIGDYSFSKNDVSFNLPAVKDKVKRGRWVPNY